MAAFASVIPSIWPMFCSGRKAMIRAQQFKRILNTGGGETTVPLKQPVPVHLVYFTAWPTPTGHVEFRRDVYGRDRVLFNALHRAGVELAGSKV